MKSSILIVDDSALLRRVECDIINSDNKLQATDTCKDGLEALEKLLLYDVLLSDKPDAKISILSPGKIKLVYSICLPLKLTIAFC
jgi:CheY-like chemotaxis protein